jgi:hypothetical protein
VPVLFVGKVRVTYISSYDHLSSEAYHTGKNTVIFDMPRGKTHFPFFP